MRLFLIICLLIADGLLALFTLGWLVIHIAVDVIERMERNEDWKPGEK